MDRLLVLVNGLPGAGKTTVGTRLARTLNARFLSKDAIKEALASCLDNDTDFPQLGGIAMDTVWALAQAIPGDVVIDSWWFKPRDLTFARAGLTNTMPSRVVEVWCDVPAPVAKARYASRHRAAIYQDQQRLAEDWDHWAELAEPLGLTPTVRVDTTRTVDYIDLAQQSTLAADRPGPPIPDRIPGVSTPLFPLSAAVPAPERQCRNIDDESSA